MVAGVRTALALVWVVNLTVGGCASPSEGTLAEPTVTQSVSESVSGQTTAATADVIPSEEPTPSWSVQPSESPLLVALTDAMLTPRDLRGNWKVAPDGESGGPLAGFYCEEGWPELDEIQESQPPWQAYTELVLDEPEAFAGGSEEDLPLVSESVVTGEPAAMARAYRTLNDLLDRCLKHNAPEAGEDATYLPMPAPEVGKESFGFEIQGPVGDTHYTAVVLTGPALVKIGEVHILEEDEAGSLGLGKDGFGELVATAVARLPQ